MRPWAALRLGWLVFAAAAVFVPVNASAATPRVEQADLNGDINNIMSAYIQTSVSRAEADHADALLVVMNTPGGISTSMDEIVTDLLNSTVPVVVYVYPSGALAASGSVALELALARLPMVVGYRLNPLTEAFLDRVLKVRQVNLVNLLLGRPLVSELLGPNCTPARLAASLAELIGDELVRATHRQGYDEAVRRLAGDGVSPSLRAADQILELVAARRRGISGSTTRRSAR